MAQSVDLVSAVDALAFVLDTAPEAALGDQVFAVRTAGGDATFSLSILPSLPVIGVGPLPLALPIDSSLRQLMVSLSNADVVDRVITLTITDPTVAELAVPDVTIAAGDTEALVGIRGLVGGGPT